VGIALRIVRLSSVARDPLLASPFQGEGCFSLVGMQQTNQVKLSAEQAGVLGFVAHAGDVGAEGRAADVVERA
jgi:hypothetical protein